MKQEFTDAIKLVAEEFKNKLLQDAHTDWAQTYSRMNLTPAQAKELAAKYLLNFMAQELYLHSSKNLLK